MTNNSYQTIIYTIKRLANIKSVDFEDINPRFISLIKRL